MEVFIFNFRQADQLERMIRENGWQLKDGEEVIKGKRNWLIQMNGSTLMIMTGTVPVEVLQELRRIE